MALSSAAERAASASLDQINVSGEAIALTWDSIDPGYGFESETGAGTSATRASRKLLPLARKQIGDASNTRPATKSGTVAAAMAASVPPSEWPMRTGFSWCDLLSTVSSA